MMQCIQNKECVGLVKRNLQSIKQFNSGDKQKWDFDRNIFEG